MVGRPLSVALVEPWFAGSHRAWATGYQRSSAHHVHVMTMPGRFWRWRLRGAAVTLAAALERQVAASGPPDVLLATSMVDLAQLTGLTRHLLGDTRVVLYLHENQVAYTADATPDHDAAYRCWTSLLAADQVVVNSRWHLEALADGLRRLLPQAPDFPHDDQLERVLADIVVVPVGVDLAEIEPPPERAAGPPVVLWNHRWDDDKQPDVFVRALEKIAAAGIDYRVILGGEDAWGADGGDRRSVAEQRLAERVLRSGWAVPDQYRHDLAVADVVVSVARHECFGVSVVEAMAAGAVPVLPRALSYPEIVPERFHQAAFYEPGRFRARLQEVLSDLSRTQLAVEGLASTMAAYDWPNVAPMLDRVLAAEGSLGSTG